MKSMTNALQSMTTEYKPDSDYGNEAQNVAATKIQAGLRGYNVRKSNAAKINGNPNAYGRFMMVNKNHNDHHGNHLVYYFDEAGVSPVARRPEKKVYSHYAETSGRSKALEAKDEHFVELSNNDYMGFDRNADQRRAIAKHLAPYRSCCPTIQLDNQTVIARSGGTQLQTLLVHKKQKPEIMRFKQVCTDLTDMLRKDIIPLDIKAENMAIPFDDKKGCLVGEARMIDTEDTIVPSIQTDPSQYNLTPEMTTQSLMQQVKSGNIDMAKRNAVYAMLLVLTEATDEPLRAQPQTEGTKIFEEWDEEFGQNFVRQEVMLFETSRVSLQNHKIYKAWVEQHIKPEHRQQVRQFLTNPARNSLPADLAGVIDWDS